MADLESLNPSQMGQKAGNAMDAVFNQMRSLYGSAKTNAQLRAMQGVTPMIGLNDVTPEVFTLQGDAPLLLSAAQSNHIGLLAMWSLGRNQACTVSPQVSPTCSGVPQAPYGFSSIFKAFTVF